jgi:hypothetical protein
MIFNNILRGSARRPLMQEWKTSIGRATASITLPLAHAMWLQLRVRCRVNCWLFVLPDIIRDFQMNHPQTTLDSAPPFGTSSTWRAMPFHRRTSPRSPCPL